MEDTDQSGTLHRRRDGDNRGGEGTYPRIANPSRHSPPFSDGAGTGTAGHWSASKGDTPPGDRAESRCGDRTPAVCRNVVCNSAIRGGIGRLGLGRLLSSDLVRRFDL